MNSVSIASKSSSSSSVKKGTKRKLDTSASHQSLWLVKIPAQVAENWRSAQFGESLGSLSLDSVATNGVKHAKMSIQLRGDTAAAASSNSVITDFTLNELKSSTNNLIVFESSNEGLDSFAVKGHVSKFMTLTPKDNERYREALRERQLAASTKSRTVKTVDSRTAFDHNTKSREVGFTKYEKRDDADERSRGEKASEAELKELKKKILGLFAFRTHLTFKEIKFACQTFHEQDIRDFLRKYCDYHSKGQLKSNYELKAEYKGTV